MVRAGKTRLLPRRKAASRRVIHPLKPQEVTCLKRSSSSLLIQFASFRQVFKKIGFEITNEILYLGEPLSECVE